MFQKKSKLTDSPEADLDVKQSSDQQAESRTKPMSNTPGARTYGVDNALRPKSPVYGQAPEEKKQGSRLHVGADIHLKGEITSCDRLIVEGVVEASMDSKEIEISKSGVFNGTVNIDTADISGTFDGTMKARTRLVVRKTGRVTGEISYGEIEIEPGGEIGGTLKRIAKEQPTLLSEMEKDKADEKSDSKSDGRADKKPEVNGSQEASQPSA